MKPGRNDPCFCGSGKKYKNCCLGKAELKSPARTANKIDQLGTLFNTGRYAELEYAASGLLKKNPDAGVVWKLYGLGLQMQGKDGLPALQKAAKLLPDDAEAHCNLAVVLRDRGQLEAAVASYRKALDIRPGFAEAHNNLGVALRTLGQADEAVNSYRKAVALKPDFFEAYNNLGSTLKALGQADEAVSSYRRALALRPDLAVAHNNLGIALKDMGQLEAALASHRKAVELKPDWALAHNGLGIVLKDIGQLDAAVASLRKALELDPGLTMAHNNLMLALSYTTATPELCMQEAMRFGQMASKKVTARYAEWHCASRPDRLRVGLVSGDLCESVLGYFMEGVLAQIDSDRIELIAYSAHRKEDELTARIRPYFAGWKPLYNLSDEAAAKLIHADGVHVLLDVSGHTANNRLPVFSWKPAPVQASWLGYFATTGVAEMDYILADAVGVPEAHRKDFLETVWYLPDTRMCFTPPASEFHVAPLPALKNGYITFGCFQILPKVGDAVLATWAKVLHALPDARLRLQCVQLGDPSVAQQVSLRLQQQGIDPARVTLHGGMSRADYLNAHAEVDVILDTFPFPGGATTCEALWMGVPTLTLAGDTLLARQGASLLTAAGLPEWVATRSEEYVDKAVVLARDMPKLAALRSGLRERVRVSPLFDAQRFAKHFVRALEGMWEAHAHANPVPRSKTSEHA